MERVANAEVEKRFVERWSPRSFDRNYELSSEQLDSIFEAARWAPSSFNEQPWRFIIAQQSDSYFQNFVDLLVEQNQKWAKDASVLGFIVASTIFKKNGKENRHAVFDCGSAWMSLTMQAREIGLYTHGMAGIHYEEIYRQLNIPHDRYQVVCGFAIGKKAPKENLPEAYRDKEEKNDRKRTEEFVFKGKFFEASKT